MTGALAGADVAIVGGGIIGAACAYELARTGLSVVLCEKDDLALGASGRNPGFVWMHTRRPGTQLVLSRFTRDRLVHLPEELDWDFDLRTNGGLIFVHTSEQLAVMKEFVEARRELGLDIDLLDGDQARELAPILPERVIGASFCKEDAQITTAKLVEGLARAAERAGATILRGTEVLEVRSDEGRTTGVETTAGRIDAGAVVLAAGVWTPGLTAPFGIDLPIRPMRLQVVATDVQPAMLDRLLYGPSAIRQYDLFHSLPSYRDEYFVRDDDLEGELPFLELACQTSEGRFLLGCPMDFPGDVWQPDLAGVALICRSLTDAIPALRVVGFERAWAGLLPHTPDSLPVIDELPSPAGTFIAAGHVFGNSSALATAAIVCALVQGEEPELDTSELRIDRPELHASAGTRW
jgi:glycine/D-amino acid oxidase-like deaminating enzyme